MWLIHPNCRGDSVILRAITVAFVNGRIQCDIIPIEIWMFTV